MKMRKAVFVFAAVAAFICLAGSLTLWLLLSSWIPAKGKALLIQTLEQQAPIQVSIGAMRYELFRGLVAEEIRVIDRRSQELWVSAPAMRVQVGWPTLLMQRALTFFARVPLEAPCQTTVALSGRYSLRDHSLKLDVQTTDLPVRTFGAPARRYLPDSLTDGVLRLTLHFTQQPHTLPAVVGRVVGAHLAWTTPTWQARGDLTVNGSVTPPTQPGDPWRLQGLATVRHGALSGLPVVETITNMDATAHVEDDAVQLEQLTGTVFGSPWHAEGTITRIDRPTVELLLTSHVELTPLAQLVEPLKDTWRPMGASDVRAVCRGPLLQPAALDCLVHAGVRDVTLTGSQLASPITNITGQLEYDHLTQRLTLTQLDGRILGHALSTRGEIALAHPMRLALDVTGPLPLEALTGWLPAHGLINALGGIAELDVSLQGPMAELRPTGRVDLRDAQIGLSTRAHTIDHLTGSVFLEPQSIDLRQLSLQFDKQPVTVTAGVDLRGVPRIVATIGVAHGRCELTSRITPKDIVIDQASVSLEQSQVQLQGRLARRPAQPSTLKLSGTVELSELAHLPFLPLPALDPWKLAGSATVDARVEGRLSAWEDATIQARVFAPHVSVREIPFDQLTCTIEQADRTLRARVPSASAAEGKLWAEATVKHQARQQDYVFEADLVGLQLAKLREVIPAWQSRQVNGSASAHALLSGTWEDRSSWRGEGWVNASGERLGDLPLLDKVFSGLFGVLGDRLGLDSLRRAQISQASVRWRLSDERLRTENLRLAGLAGPEPVAIYAKGSVGLDQTLDFIIEPELSEGVLLQAPTTSSLASTVLKAAGQLEHLRQLIGRHHLTGTLKDPKYRFELSTQEVFKELTPGAADFLQNLLDAVR